MHCEIWASNPSVSVADPVGASHIDHVEFHRLRAGHLDVRPLVPSLRPGVKALGSREHRPRRLPTPILLEAFFDLHVSQTTGLVKNAELQPDASSNPRVVHLSREIREHRAVCVRSFLTTPGRVPGAGAAQQRAFGGFENALHGVARGHARRGRPGRGALILGSCKMSPGSSSWRASMILNRVPTRISTLPCSQRAMFWTGTASSAARSSWVHPRSVRSSRMRRPRRSGVLNFTLRHWCPGHSRNSIIYGVVMATI